MTQPAASLEAQEEKSGQLKFSGSVSGDGLRMVTSVEISRDGKFLYASAWQAATITVFGRDAISGELTQVQELTDYENLQGATALRLSPDGRFAVTTAFRSKTAVLYGRDPQGGRLTQLDVAQNNAVGDTGLQWPIDAAFSPDSKFVYIIDSRGSGRGGAVMLTSVWMSTSFGELPTNRVSRSPRE